MNVRVVCMTMSEFGVQVWVAVWFTINLIRTMLMLVMFVVNMTMSVVYGYVSVKMLMPLCRTQQNTDTHGQ